jgi:hypothetical protein
MSGGRFDYDQYRIKDIAEKIDLILRRQGDKKYPEDHWQADLFRQYPELGFYETYSPEVQEAMKKAVNILNESFVYAQRIDYFLSSDDSEESFLKRLKEDLDKLKKL